MLRRKNTWYYSNDHTKLRYKCKYLTSLKTIGMNKKPQGSQRRFPHNYER